MTKRKTVFDEEGSLRAKEIKGETRHGVKMAAIKAQSCVQVDRKKEEKRGGKNKHKGQGRWPSDAQKRK
jgi:hypothetical protein